MSDNKPFNLQLLWNKTENGLLYFHEVYPDSVGKENKSKHFKTHKENTPSSTLSNKKSKNKIYYVTNHSDSNSQNMIDHCMTVNHFDFIEACDFLFQKYGLAKATLQQFKPDTEFKDTDLEPGTWNIEYLPKIENYKAIAPFLTEDICAEYDFKSVKSYQRVFVNRTTNQTTVITVTANEFYPIFAYDQKSFAKVYEPKAAKDDKYNNKHHFLGTKPERFIYGWDRLFDLSNEAEIDFLLDDLKDEKRPQQRESIKEKIQDLKIDNVIIATGGSDGLNLASLGYNVIWFNSEAEIISSDEYYKLSKIVKTVYYLPDLDKTGVKQAVAMGMQFLRIKMIWLPEYLKAERKKDIADWVRKYKTEKIEKVKAKFKQMFGQALEFQFWEWSSKRGTYSLNNKIMLYFLKHNGFYINRILLKSADSQSEVEKTRIVHIHKNIVRTVSPRQVKAYVLKWLEDHFIDIKIYNMILKSVYFSDNALLSLHEVEIDTKTATPKSQLYYFKDKVARITPEKIEALEYRDVDNLVWQSDIVPNNFKLQEKHFTIAKDEAGSWKIDVHQNVSNYFKVLVNTSRMFWEKDQDATGMDLNKFNINSDKLTVEENAMQELQLINKIFAVGYMLHKYKIKQNAYFTLGLDHKNGNSTRQSNGRSGKSFIQDVLRCFLKNWKDKNGKLLPKEDPKFIYDKVTGSTDYILFDDLHEFQDYNFFFAVTTGPLEANHKGGEIYDIPFEDSPKLGGTSNFAPINLSASLQGRLLFYYASDYYHQKTEDNGYHFTRQIADDFDGRTILDKNYPETDWNNDYNFMLQCLQFYLAFQNEKIEAPIDGLLIKNLRQIIGDSLLKFFVELFKENENLNNWVHKKDAYDDYKSEIGGKAKSSQTFKENLIHYCKTQKWTIEFKKQAEVNPHTGKRNSVEHFFIHTTETAIDVTAIPIGATEAQPEMNFDNNEDNAEPETDLPF